MSQYTDNIKIYRCDDDEANPDGRYFAKVNGKIISHEGRTYFGSGVDANAAALIAVMNLEDENG